MAAASGLPYVLKSEQTPEGIAHMLITVVYEYNKHVNTNTDLTKRINGVLKLTKEVADRIVIIEGRVNKLEDFIPLLEEGRTFRKYAFRLLWVIVPAVITAGLVAWLF
jgi:hypothetical protein